MFGKAYDFTFNGVSASNFGLMLCDIGSNKHSNNSFGNKANIVEKRLADRVAPLHYGVRYNDEPLEFTLIFAGERKLTLFEQEEVNYWLCGSQQYSWLSIDSQEYAHLEFRCFVTELKQISVGWYPIGFEATIRCDSPYAYGPEFTETYEVVDELSVLFRNNGSCKELMTPVMTVELDDGCRNFSMTNETVGETMAFAELPTGGLRLTIDFEDEIITESTGNYNVYDYFNFVFPDFVQGDNRITLSGTGTVTITGRFLYAVVV